MSTLKQLVATVGEALVHVICAPKGLDGEIRDVLVHDRSDPMDFGSGDLVLGVGYGTTDDPLPLVHELASKDVAGLVLKWHAINDEVRRVAEAADLALVAVERGTSWAQVLALMQTALRHGGFYVDADDGEIEAGDLFALADAIAALVDAPVTIEDRLSRVIAYSGRQTEADAARAETIVGRKVPERFVRRFEKEGVFARLQKAGGAIYLEDIEEDVLPRLAVAVKAGPQLLGYIWAACSDKPTPTQTEAFERASQVAALHLLRHRAGADIERKIEADLVAAALSGGTRGPNALARLGFSGGSLAVIAMGPADAHASPEPSSLMQARDIVLAQLAVNRLKGRAAVFGEGVYGLVESADPEAVVVRRVASESVDRIRESLAIDVVVGISRIAQSAADIPVSHEEADICLHVLQAGLWNGPVASIDEVRVHALLLRLGDIAGGEKDVYTRRLAPLLRSDSEKGTVFLRSLAAYLEEFGDIQKASKRLLVHPNTLRYRLRRIEEVAKLDLGDSNERLALAVILAAFPEIKEGR